MNKFVYPILILIGMITIFIYMETNLYEHTQCEQLKRNYDLCQITCPKRVDLFDVTSWDHIFDDCNKCVLEKNIWQNCKDDVKYVKYGCKLIAIFFGICIYKKIDF